jgi:hypothetical protein
VAVNVYPGTWSPPAATAAPDPAKVATTLRATLTALRKHHMPAAGLRRNVRLVIGETGYPTTPARSEAYQDAVLRAVVTTVEPMRATYRITDLYWFGLRDGNTASAQLENGYGLLRDDYSAKPAFETFRELVAGS